MIQPTESVVNGRKVRTYRCGCENYFDSDWEVWRNLNKCNAHQMQAGRGGRDYYTELGNFVDGIPQNNLLMHQLVEALGNDAIPQVRIGPSRSFEIGCGIGSYVPLLLAKGHQYEAVELDEWAAKYVAEAYGVGVYNQRFEDIDPPPRLDLILAAHVLEHFSDPFGCLGKMFNLLERGGKLVLIVPDDEDPINPDHLTFFTVPSLLSILTRIGFRDFNYAVRRHTNRENFIYCSVRRP